MRLTSGVLAHWGLSSTMATSRFSASGVSETPGPCGFMPRKQCCRRSFRPQAQDLDFLNKKIALLEATTAAPVAA